MNKKNFKKILHSKASIYVVGVPTPLMRAPSTTQIVSSNVGYRGDPKLDRLVIGKSIVAVRKVELVNYLDEISQWITVKEWIGDTDEDGEPTEGYYQDREVLQVLRPAMESTSVQYMAKQGKGNGTIIRLYHPQARVERHYAPTTPLSDMGFTDARYSPLYQSGWN